MQLFDPNNPNEKKKMIVAAVLGLAALLLLGYLFLGGSSSKPSVNRPVATATPTPRPPRGPENGPPPSDEYKEVVFRGTAPPASEADRNIFAYYEPPPPPVKVPSPPPPTPTPPLVATSLSPQSVYARTGDFSLQVMGDKFVAGVNITIDGRMMQTRFISAQQLATTVPADMIANPGTRQVTLKNANGTLYSNNVSLVVTPPPLPNFNYVGLIGKPRFNDWAVLQDKSSKELINVQRGDVVGGRFRVNSISDKEVVLIDTNLKIRHTVTFTTETANSPSRPPARRPPVDDEP
jgi:IPT/TIG domain